MMKEEMGRVEKEKTGLDVREAELRGQLERRIITDEQEDQIRNLVQRVSAGLEVLDFAGRQELLRLLVERVLYDGQKLEIQTIIPLNGQLHPLHREVRVRVKAKVRVTDCFALRLNSD